MKPDILDYRLEIVPAILLGYTGPNALTREECRSRTGKNELQDIIWEINQPKFIRRATIRNAMV